MGSSNLSQGHVPTAAEDAVINSGVNLTVGTGAVCGSLTIGNATTTNTTLTLGAGGSLVISGTTGNLTFNPNGVNNTLPWLYQRFPLSVAGTVSFQATGTSTISDSTGTVTFSNLLTCGLNRTA